MWFVQYASNVSRITILFVLLLHDSVFDYQPIAIKWNNEQLHMQNQQRPINIQFYKVQYIAREYIKC
jgi:hypothetical protein